MGLGFRRVDWRVMKLVSLLILLTCSLSAQGLDYVLANYTKFEFRVPMRDGKRLFTSVYAPKDHSKTYPFLMQRTPYSCGPYGIENYRSSLGQGEAYVREGYIFVCQDVRGRYESAGKFM